MYKALVPYSIPKWASELAHIPAYKLQLSHTPTPIHRWCVPGLPEGVTLHIKRDDMTGCELSGNKIRKLEFLLGDARQRGCDHVITCGGLQSNHCRATVAAGTQLGLTTHLLLRTDAKSVDELEYNGNLLLDVLGGAKLYLIHKTSRYETDIKPKMEQVADSIRESGGVPYSIPVGGSDCIGVFGYISAFQELMDQNVLEDFDDVVVTVGSGGTIAGLAVANYLTGEKVRLHAVSVCDSAPYFHGHINDMLDVLEVGQGRPVRSEDLVDIIDGYKGRGYGLSTPEEIDFLLEVSAATGIYLDPTYTLKGLRGLVQELISNKSRFRGNRLLFIHTGGIFGSMDGRINTHVKQKVGAVDLSFLT